MPPTLVMVHGWGLGPGMWGPLVRALAWEGGVVRPDLGFFGLERPLERPAGPWVGIGHSLGFVWLLQWLRREGVEGCAGVVSMGGFSRFVAGGGLEQGVPPRLLHRMGGRLGEAPHQVLEEFGRRAGMVMRGEGALRPERLGEGLEWLARWDEREFLEQWRGGLLALAARDDPIVGPEHAAACFPPEVLRWRERGGHGLPLSAPQWCAERLREWWEPLAAGEVNG